MIAKIAVAAATFAIDKPYSYCIPQGMVLLPGQRVSVPFGRGNRRTEGIVLSVEEGIPEGLKCVETCLDPEPILSRTMLQMAAFIRDRYFCTFYDAVRAMLPAGLNAQNRQIFRLTEDRSWKEKSPRQPEAMAVLQQLEALGGSAGEEVLQGAAADEDAFQGAIRYLLRKKWISDASNFKIQAKDKTEKIATLAVPAEEAMAYAAQCMRAPMQRAVLELLCSIGSGAVKEICYFTGAGTPTVKRLEKLGYLVLSDRQVLRCREIKPAVLDGPMVLNEEQEAAFLGLRAQLEDPNPGAALLYGVTGSGKTAVYLKLIQSCLRLFFIQI